MSSYPRAVAAAAIAVAALSSCSDGGHASAEPSGQSTAQASTPQAPVAPQQIRPGDTFTIWEAGSQAIDADWTLLGVDAHPSVRDVCGTPELTHPVALHLLVDATRTSTGSTSTTPTWADIREDLPGGTVATKTAVASCNSFNDGRAELLSVNKGTKQEGWLILDVTKPEGSLRVETNGRPATIAYP